MQIVRTINVSYKVAKSNFIWKKKEEETKKNIGKQLKGVSNAIKSMAKEIEKDIKVEEQYQKESAFGRAGANGSCTVLSEPLPQSNGSAQRTFAKYRAARFRAYHRTNRTGTEDSRCRLRL